MSIDIGATLIAAITDFVTALFVTIPNAFISAALDGGVLFDIFFSLFGSDKFFQVLFIAALVLGPWIWIRSLNTKQTRKTKDLSKRQ